MIQPPCIHEYTKRQRGYRLTPSWSLVWTLVAFSFALGYAWHYGSVATHPELYTEGCR